MEWEEEMYSQGRETGGREVEEEEDEEAGITRLGREQEKIWAEKYGGKEKKRKGEGGKE